MERAARFLYLQRLAFAGQVNGVFGVSAQHGARFSLSKLEPLLDAAHERLDGVVFENLDWADLVRRYDSPVTLFYLDPPYWGGEDDYGKGLFGRDKFEAMAEILGDIEGAFILSINDRPEIRGLFGGFNLEEVSVRYTVSRSEAVQAKELIVSNRVIRTGLI